MQRQLVLAVDDDAPILRLVRARLTADGYAVITASGGVEAVEKCEEERPDIVILDVMMPDIDGIETMRRIREFSEVPIVLLTARSGAADMIHGLDSGADDYIAKPFNPDELSARVAAILRRTTHEAPAEEIRLVYEGLVIDLDNRIVEVAGEEVRLSRTEWELLYQLASNAGRVMRHSELLSRIWGPEFRDETYYLRTWISRLRAKLEPDHPEESIIQTYPGMGYRLVAPE
ncbi:MAG: response regulator transcription factor [Thermomicrobiales bacterium]